MKSSSPHLPARSYHSPCCRSACAPHGPIWIETPSISIRRQRKQLTPRAPVRSSSSTPMAFPDGARSGSGSCSPIGSALFRGLCPVHAAYLSGPLSRSASVTGQSSATTCSNRLPAGSGGLAVTSDSDRAQRLRTIRDRLAAPRLADDARLAVLRRVHKTLLTPRTYWPALTLYRSLAPANHSRSLAEEIASQIERPASRLSDYQERLGLEALEDGRGSRYSPIPA